MPEALTKIRLHVVITIDVLFQDICCYVLKRLSRCRSVKQCEGRRVYGIRVYFVIELEDIVTEMASGRIVLYVRAQETCGSNAILPRSNSDLNQS